jgi:hypothetical protein
VIFGDFGTQKNLTSEINGKYIWYMGTSDPSTSRFLKISKHNTSMF